MSDERVSPELLAAFLDGTATDEERSAVLRTLSSSRTAYAEFLEASAVHRDFSAVEESERPIAATSPATRPTSPSAPQASRPSRLRYILPALLAAGIALVLIARPGRLIRSSSGDAAQLVQLASLTSARGSGALAATLGPAWQQPPWSATRGVGSVLPPAALTFRAGARYAQLELAAWLGDSTAGVQAADALAELIATKEAGAPFAAIIRAFPRSSDFGGATQRAATARQLGELLGSQEWFDLGVWTETARVAVAARDVAFFAPGSRGIAELRRLAEKKSDATTQEGADWNRTVETLRPLLAGTTWTASDLQTLGGTIAAAITVAAR